MRLERGQASLYWSTHELQEPHKYHECLAPDTNPLLTWYYKMLMKFHLKVNVCVCVCVCARSDKAGVLLGGVALIAGIKIAIGMPRRHDPARVSVPMETKQGSGCNLASPCS